MEWKSLCLVCRYSKDKYKPKFRYVVTFYEDILPLDEIHNVMNTPYEYYSIMCTNAQVDAWVTNTLKQCREVDRIVANWQDMNISLPKSESEFNRLVKLTAFY